MRRVCVFTGSRADYGPLRPLMRALDADPEIDLRILVTGGHLVHDQGLTTEELRADGFTAHQFVEMVVSSDTATGVAKSFGLGAIGYADALDGMEPDILVVLGDRYEALAVTIVAALRLLPVAHISGGEVTRGSTDDSTRHAITKLAHLHFATTEDSRQRIIQMGEQPDRVVTSGSLSIDTIRTAALLDKSALQDDLGTNFQYPVITVTYHPATADPDNSYVGAVNLLRALDQFPNSTVIFTGTNLDHGGNKIRAQFHDYVARQGDRASIHHSLGQHRYLSLVKQSDIVVGNSSSALIEAPALGTPTVNIGSRQDGRPRAQSVIDCDESLEAVSTALRKALSSEHKAKAATARSPYGDGYSAGRITEILKAVDLKHFAKKIFHDVNSMMPSQEHPASVHAKCLAGDERAVRTE